LRVAEVPDVVHGLGNDIQSETGVARGVKHGRRQGFRIKAALSMVEGPDNHPVVQGLGLDKDTLTAAPR